MGKILKVMKEGMYSVPHLPRRQKKEWIGESTANGYDHQIFDISKEKK